MSFEQLNLKSEDEVEAILSLAIRKSSDEIDLKSRLMETARELGISEEAVMQAAKEYSSKRAVTNDLAEYQEYRKRGFIQHLVPYVVVNAFLIFMARGDSWWIYPCLGWGIGLAIHFGNTFFTKPSVTDDEFLTWRMKRRALDND